MARLNSTRTIDGQTFILSEKLDDYRTACLAQAEYWAEGLCCRKEPVETKRETTYYIWVGPERQRRVRTLSHEHVTRERGARLWRVS